MTLCQIKLLGLLDRYESELIRMHQFPEEGIKNLSLYHGLVNMAIGLAVSIREEIAVGEHSEKYYSHQLGCLSGLMFAAIAVSSDCEPPFHKIN